MTDTKHVKGVMNIYNSEMARGFEETAVYPLAMEIMYVNDNAGKDFTINALQTLETAKKQGSKLMELTGKTSDVARSIELAFQDNDSFRHFINKAFDGFVFYDESKGKVFPKRMMLDEAKKLEQGMAMAV